MKQFSEFTKEKLQQINTILCPHIYITHNIILLTILQYSITADSSSTV